MDEQQNIAQLISEIRQCYELAPKVCGTDSSVLRVLAKEATRYTIRAMHLPDENATTPKETLAKP